MISALERYKSSIKQKKNIICLAKLKYVQTLQNHGCRKIALELIFHQKSCLNLYNHQQVIHLQRLLATLHDLHKQTKDKLKKIGNYIDKFIIDLKENQFSVKLHKDIFIGPDPREILEVLSNFEEPCKTLYSKMNEYDALPDALLGFCVKKLQQQMIEFVGIHEMNC